MIVTAKQQCCRTIQYGHRKGIFSISSCIIITFVVRLLCDIMSMLHYLAVLLQVLVVEEELGLAWNITRNT